MVNPELFCIFIGAAAVGRMAISPPPGVAPGYWPPDRPQLVSVVQEPVVVFQIPVIVPKRERELLIDKRVVT